MTIPTQMSLQGFIATAPQLTFTGNGTARFYARIGVEHFRKETDASYTKLDSTFHDVVMFKATAERAYARFRVGDSFVASGYIHEYEQEKQGQIEAREEFVARRVGHDTARTRYDVDRSPSRQSEPPVDQIEARHEPIPAIGL
ncbi:MAG: single-stranded DNA-binding protein [Kineosporiaceae bacterium]|nr:single-stranded DNA-binding protein [Aeromicrobium sp.]